MKNNSLFTLVIVGLLSCPAGLVLAQESAPAPEEAPVGEGQEVLNTTETAEADVVTTTAVDSGSKLRFRWGMSGAGGPITGGYSGGAGSLDLRFGAQITEMFGAYIQPILLVGAAANVDFDSASLTGFGLYGAALMGDATFLDMFYVASGIEVLGGGVAEASGSTTAVSASADTGPFFSIPVRAGIALGSRHSGSRKAFTIGLDMHVVFAQNVAVMPLIALGYEMF